MFPAAPPSMSDGPCAEQSTRNPSGGSADPAACNELQASVEAVDTQQRLGRGRQGSRSGQSSYNYLRFDRPFPIGYSPNLLFSF
jgi:hypothetical protein